MKRQVLIAVIIQLFILIIVSGLDIDTNPIINNTPTSPSPLSLSDKFKNKLQTDNSLRDDIMKRFQNYLRLPTQQPNPNYLMTIDFLIDWTLNIFNETKTTTTTFSELYKNVKTVEYSKFKYHVFHCDESKPNYILTWKGKNPNKGSIMMNSHMDVVPVDKSNWKYPPYEATMVNNDDNNSNNADEKGRRIYSRGSQDMKCVGSAYMETLTNLINSGFEPDRNLHILFVADEEIGGGAGWQCLIENHSMLWKDLNIQFGLDEGLASGINDDIIPIYYGENIAWWFEITATGNVGHGSQFISQTATEKLSKLLSEKVFPFREQQELIMKLQTNNTREKNQCSTVITINLTGLKSGHVENGKFTNPNVIPSSASALFDMRIPPHIDLNEVKRMLYQWAEYVNGSLNFIDNHDAMENPSSDLNDPLVREFLFIVNSRMKSELRIFPAATDSRYPRRVGINVLGYSYMPNTKVLLHDHDEYLDEYTYLESIVHYIAIFEGLLKN